MCVYSNLWQINQNERSTNNYRQGLSILSTHVTICVPTTLYHVVDLWWYAGEYHNFAKKLCWYKSVYVSMETQWRNSEIGSSLGWIVQCSLSPLQHQVISQNNDYSMFCCIYVLLMWHAYNQNSINYVLIHTGSCTYQSIHMKIRTSSLYAKSKWKFEVVISYFNIYEHFGAKCR